MTPISAAVPPTSRVMLEVGFLKSAGEASPTGDMHRLRRQPRPCVGARIGHVVLVSGFGGNWFHDQVPSLKAR